MSDMGSGCRLSLPTHLANKEAWQRLTGPRGPNDGVELASTGCVLTGGISLALVLVAGAAALLGLVGIGAIAAVFALIGAVLLGPVAFVLALFVSRMKGPTYSADRRRALVGTAMGTLGSLVAFASLIVIVVYG